MQGQNLEDLLSEMPAEPQEIPHEAEAEQNAPPPEPTGEEQAAAPPAVEREEVPEKGFVPVTVAQDERKKRQELERRLSEYEERLKRFEQPQQPQHEQAQPDWYNQPGEAAQALQEQFQHELFQTRLALSETFMRQQHEDFEDVSVVFAEQAKRDPHLMQRLFAHPNPAQYAYQIGQQIKLMQDVGNDPAAYRKKLEEEIRAQIQAEQGGTQKTASSSQPPPQVPRSLARDVSQQPRNARGQFDGPTPLEDILG